jgi:cob(I)alamin adenosyltransferase
MKDSDQLAGTGRVVVLTGTGKGKTTAALGASLRATAYLANVVFIHFTGPHYPVLGEVKASAAYLNSLRMIGIKSEASQASYLAEFSESVDTVSDALKMARHVWMHKCDLMVLDDIGSQLEKGNIDVDQVLAFIRDKPQSMSIILTGQSMPSVINENADLVTEFTEIKRPSPASVGPRKGIDF